MRKVSIITPCYNGEAFIDRYMNMILVQTYPFLELIFIDDGSTDNTEIIVKSYEKKLLERKIFFIYHYQEHSGQAVAINRGLKIFTGDYLIYPDVDDILLPDSIKHRVDFLDKHENCGLVGSKGWDAYENNLEQFCIEAPRQEKEVKNLFEETLKNKWTTFTCTYMFRRKAFFKSVPHGQIYTNNDFTLQDVQMLLPIAYFYKCGFLDEYLYIRVIRHDSHSQKHETYSKLLLRNDATEDVFIKTITAIEMSQTKKDKYLRLVHQWFLGTRKYIFIMYGFYKKIYSLPQLLGIRLNNKKLIIFGAGSDTKNLLSLLNSNEKPYCILDNDVSKCGKILQGIPIKSISEIWKDRSKYFILIVTSRYGKKIENQLLQMGLISCKDMLLFEDLLL